MKVVDFLNFTRKWRKFVSFRVKIMNFCLVNKEKRAKRVEKFKNSTAKKRTKRERERESKSLPKMPEFVVLAFVCKAYVCPQIPQNLLSNPCPFFKLFLNFSII